MEESEEEKRLVDEYKQRLDEAARNRFDNLLGATQLLVARVMAVDAYDRFFSEFSGKKEKWQCYARCFENTEDDRSSFLAPCKKFCKERYENRQRKLFDVHYFTLRFLQKKYTKCAEEAPQLQSACLALALFKVNRRLWLYWPKKFGDQSSQAATFRL